MTRLPFSGQARKRGADAPENHLAPVSSSRWVSGNPTPLLKGPKLTVPPGTGPGFASSFSFKPLGGGGAKDKKWNLRPCVQREELGTQRVGVPGVEGRDAHHKLVSQPTLLQGLIN